MPVPASRVPGRKAEAVIHSRQGRQACLTRAKVNRIEIHEEDTFASGVALMPGGRHMKPTAKVKLLIVDDEVSLRSSLSQIFTPSGHSVRSAEDGFSALGEIRKEMPDILLSDLNMPGMSGFELLSVVRRRFPAIQVIAMSGAFSGNSVPPGIVADAFYEKGTSPSTLLEMVRDNGTHLDSEERA
jgi:CheY-like chemotaxis protein